MGFFGSIIGGLSAVGRVLTMVGNAVSAVEMFTNVIKDKGQGDLVTSADKQSMARNYVKQLITDSEILVGKEVIDEDAFNTAINQTIDGIVAIMNSVKG